MKELLRELSCIKSEVFLYTCSSMYHEKYGPLIDKLLERRIEILNELGDDAEEKYRSGLLN